MMKIKTMKSFANKVAKMKTVSRDDLEKILPDYISGGDITKVIKESLDPVNKVAVKKKFDNRKDKDIDNDGDVDSTDKYLHKRRKAISKAISKEEVEIDEGYESEVMKVLNKADIDGYFKMGKLYVNKRDGKDAKKALEDSDEITKLPKMVMEDNKMMKLTKKQRQALSSLTAKGKGSVTLPGAEFLPKKKQPMKVGRQSQVVKYEAYEIGNDYAKHTLRVTPGQTDDDVDEMIGIMQKKSTSMRETLAKMWGVSEGKNPFEKSEKKDLTKETKDGKTMTGQKPTSVQVNPKIGDK
jgi:hypothetical protein